MIPCSLTITVRGVNGYAASFQRSAQVPCIGPGMRIQIAGTEYQVAMVLVQDGNPSVRVDLEDVVFKDGFTHEQQAEVAAASHVLLKGGWTEID